MIKKAIDNLQSQITTKIQEAMKTHEAKILTQMLNFRNEQVKNRIKRKFLTIPKTAHKWLKILDVKDIGNDINNLTNIIVLNVFIARWDRYHHAKSELVDEAFGSLEFFTIMT